MGERRGTKALETWCKRVTQGYPGVKVENMTTSWRDGLAFCAMIHHFRPDLIDFASLDKSDVFGNNELAFRIAERHLGIPALLDAEDMAEYPVPDRLSILTYLSQFYQAFASNTSSPVKKSADSPDSSIVSLGNVQPSSKMEGAPPWRELCLVCGNPVYLAQRLRFEGKLYHRTCFRCARCNAQLSPASCYETVDGRFCCETCPDEDMGKDDEDEDSDLSLSQKIIVDETPQPSTSPPPHTRSKALPDVEPSPSHTASIVAMRKMLFDTYNKDTDDAKLTRVENNQKELVHSSGVKKNDLSENDDTSSRKISLGSNSETSVNTELDNKAKDSLISQDSIPTDIRLCDENAADSSVVSNEEPGSLNEEKDNLCTENKISSQKMTTEEKVDDEKIIAPPRHRNTLKRTVTQVPDVATTTPVVVVEPPLEKTPAKLNPFDDSDDDDEEELEESSLKQKTESPRKSYNPFDSDSEKEEGSSEQANDSRGGSPELSPMRKAPSKNPFDSDEGEDDAVTVKAPVPLPRKMLDTTPEPSPFPRSRLRSSMTSLSSNYSTISTQSTPRKKKPAPPPPPSPFSTLKSSPRHKKNRKAPLPPSVTSSRLSLASTTDPDPATQSPSTTEGNSKVPSGRSSPPPTHNHQLACESIANEISSIVDQIANLVENKREKDRLSLSVADDVNEAPKQSTDKTGASIESIPAEKVEENPESSFADESLTLSSPPGLIESVKMTSPAEPVRETAQSTSSLELEGDTVQKRPTQLSPLKEPPSLPPLPPPIDRPKPISPVEPKISVVSRTHAFLDEPTKPRPVSLDVSSTSSSVNCEEFASPSCEKQSKDSVNLHRKISDGSSSPYSLNKSAHGQWKRKKAPAPPLPNTPIRRAVQPMPMQKIRQELNDIEIKQQGLERQGVTLENTIRNKFESGKSITPHVEDLVLQLFELVNEKNDLFRRQAELMALRRQYNLEEEQADLEYQIRCLMARPEANKTDYDKELEEKLIRRLVEVVDMRNSIVECLDSDRIREAEEDRSINASLGYFSKTPEGIEEKKPKLMKKFYKKKKENQGLKAAKSSCDLDKDLDESEKDPKSKKKKWYGLNTLKHKH